MEFCCLYLFLYSDSIFWFSLMILKEKNNLKKILLDGVLDVNHKQENMPSANGKARPRSHSLTPDQDLAQVIDLQEIIEKKSREQREMKDRLAALSAHVTQLEKDLDTARKDLDTARKDLLKSKEVNLKLQREVREAVAQKEDMEKRKSKLEKCYLAAQGEAISVHNVDDKLENEIANKDSMHRQKEAKDRKLQVCLEVAEQKLQEMLLEVEAELVQRVAALSKAGERHSSTEERLRQLAAQLEEKSKELSWARQREQMNDEHNEHSSDTVDKLLSVSDERLQLHLKKRMAALEDKNSLLWEVENAQKHLEEMQTDKARQREQMNDEHNEHSSDTVDKLLSVSDERLQLHLKKRMAALEDKLHRFPKDEAQNLRRGRCLGDAHLRETQAHYRFCGTFFPHKTQDDTHTSLESSLHPDLWAGPEVQPLKDQDQERGQQASVLANVTQVFQSEEGVSDGKGDGVTLFSSPAPRSPSGQADAKTPAVRIQEQLHKINEETWLIRQKEIRDRWTEETESRVGSGSLSNLRRFKSSDSLNLTPASLDAGSSPPSRGRSKPERRQHSPEREVYKLCFVTPLPTIQEEVEDDTLKCESSTSASLRSLRLDRLTGSLRTASDEDIRDARNSTGSQDGPGGNPSNSNSSQDSLQKAPKKKGIKSSIGRWFGKKEKGGPGHTSKEPLGPGGCFTVQREEGLHACPFCVSPAVPTRLLACWVSCR
ncbi:liprin-alpha-1-like [Oryx dammah]|uniref:liprin-alpha-1-like n=1 Tax=Oryx dammah TaxID=59534 RepID=UPI001A9B6763|nr:liprin-alpha-1-like [Oryx dammah]